MVVNRVIGQAKRLTFEEVFPMVEGTEGGQWLNGVSVIPVKRGTNQFLFDVSEDAKTRYFFYGLKNVASIPDLGIPLKDAYGFVFTNNVLKESPTVSLDKNATVEIDSIFRQCKKLSYAHGLDTRMAKAPSWGYVSPFNENGRNSLTLDLTPIKDSEGNLVEPWQFGVKVSFSDSILDHETAV